jgi:hypothetical protein
MDNFLIGFVVGALFGALFMGLYLGYQSLCERGERVRIKLIRTGQNWTLFDEPENLKHRHSIWLIED